MKKSTLSQFVQPLPSAPCSNPPSILVAQFSSIIAKITWHEISSSALRTALGLSAALSSYRSPFKKPLIKVLELVENVGAISDLSGKARLFLVLPVALLDAFFILWIFTSLSATLSKLQARRMLAKLDIYRKFTNALAVAVIVSVGWICYELYFKSSDVYNEQWQNAWIIPAFWQVLSFSLLCVICALWAPSQNSMRYTYSGEASEEFDRDDNTLTLIKPSPMPSKDIRSPLEVGSAHGGNNGVSNGDLEEDKTE